MKNNKPLARYILIIILIPLLTLFILPVLSIPASASEQNYCTADGELVVITEMVSCATDADGTECTSYYMNETTKCPNGCDNVTRSCNPAPFQVNLIMLIVALLIFTLLGLLIKRR